MQTCRFINSTLSRHSAMTTLALVLLSAVAFAGTCAVVVAQHSTSLDIPSTPAGTPQYEVFQLPPFPGFPSPRTMAINNSGHVCGHSLSCPVPSSCFSRAWLFDVKLHDISAEFFANVPPDFHAVSYSIDMNDADQVLIRALVFDSNPGGPVYMYHYLWDDGDLVLINGNPDIDHSEDDPLAPFPPPPGIDETLAWKINNNGTIVGRVRLTPEVGNMSHAFLWERGKGVVELLDPPRGYGSIGGYDVNDQGHIVGYLSGGPDLDGFLWVDGEITIIKPLSGDFRFIAYGVNDAGYVVGVSTSQNFKDSLLLWHDAGIVDAVTLPNSNVIQYPWKINAHAEVVGNTWTIGDAPQPFGFRWAQDDGFMDLNGTTPDVPNLIIWDATGINDHGQIAAWGDYAPDFTSAAVILTPIPDEPKNPADINGDGVVNGFDLLILLANWGKCRDCNDCPADLNQDCVVNGIDLVALLSNWGPYP